MCASSSPYVGGGYGSKSYTKIEPLVSAASWLARRPVKLHLSVEESILTTRADARRPHPHRLRCRRQDHRPPGDVNLNTGAYAENRPLVLDKSANRIVGPYPFRT